MRSYIKKHQYKLPKFIHIKEAIELSGKSRVLFYYAKRLDPTFPQPTPIEYKRQVNLMYSSAAIRQYFQKIEVISKESINKDTPNVIPEFVNTQEAIELSGKSPVLFNYAKRLDPEFPQPRAMKHKGRNAFMYSSDAIHQYFQKLVA